MDIKLAFVSERLEIDRDEHGASIYANQAIVIADAGFGVEATFKAQYRFDIDKARTDLALLKDRVKRL